MFPKGRTEKMPKKIFTRQELRAYDGVTKPEIYIGIRNLFEDDIVVFDVSEAKDFYGPEGMYNIFAGKDASRGLALTTLDESQVEGDFNDLDPSCLESLTNWYVKFHVKYPKVGRLESPFLKAPTPEVAPVAPVAPVVHVETVTAKTTPDRVITAVELAKCDGTSDSPIYLAVYNLAAKETTVFDVTSAKKFYGPGGPYHNFSAKDSSHGLALNSLDPEQMTGPIDNLTDSQKASLEKWYHTFDTKYPRVGKLQG